MRLWLCCGLLMAGPPPGGPQEERILGLASDSSRWLGEGITNLSLHPRGRGTLKAIMLFARFPDAEEERKTPRELYEHLVPGAAGFFRSSSYGRFDLEVDVRERWYDMSKPSTDPGYDGSRHETHKAYVAEVVAAADKDVDFRAYEVVYVVASRNKGTPISPTLHASRGEGIRADGHEICHAVTFGNDSRNGNWGWQTLVHETGHILGLPDLYNYDRVKGDRKSGHRFVGTWDPMGYQGHGSDFLAWHKHKLSWLGDAHFEVRKEGTVTRDLSHIRTSLGLKAVVAPVSETEAYVAEVKNLNASRDRAGVLIYRVATDVASGKGPIRVMPAVPDDDGKHPELFREYFAHYHAQYFAGDHFEDAARRVRIDVLSATEDGFRVKVSR